MSSSAEDASSSPEAGIEQESDIMTDTNKDLASRRGRSPSRTPGIAKQTTIKSNAQDPSRPKRKKARRACFACQRAHLTCGDERPCQRCVKRGLQNNCQDGARKKAKYLHDAPVDVLMPGYASQYHTNDSQSVPDMPAASHIGSNGITVSRPGSFYAPNPSRTYSQYEPVSQQSQMGPPIVGNSSLANDFSVPPNVDTPSQYQSNSSQTVSPQQDLTNTIDRPSVLRNVSNNSYEVSFLDPTEASMLDFNTSDMNFGNRYGALELSMLGHLSSGAVNTPDIEAMNSMAPNASGISYDDPSGFPTNFGYSQTFPSWQSISNIGSTQNDTASAWGLQTNGMDAYAVGEHQASIAGESPYSRSQEFNCGYHSTATSPETQFPRPDQGQHQQELLRQSILQAQQHHLKNESFPANISRTNKRDRETSEIYSSVSAPYPYTQGFHSLTAFLHKRFPSKKVLRIAKALASVRPSFISCNKNLNFDDLILVEKCFQRTLVEFEGYIGSVGTPTVICRRTGEIAGISKEFSLITGWRQDVLLGKEPNLNVNIGGDRSGSQTGSSSRGAVTPRNPNIEIDTGRPQPVFLAEIMDEDSVVQFYEDFAELAFGASRSSVIGTACSLIKYKTKDDPGWKSQDQFTDNEKTVGGKNEKTEQLMRGDASMKSLGEKDGRVDCVMCWTVKRDVFDMPMLISMNFLPVI